MTDHGLCSWCLLTAGHGGGSLSPEKAAERKELAALFVELRSRLSALKPKTKERYIGKLPPLLYQHFRENRQSTVDRFCATDAGRRFYRTHVWRTVQLWVRLGHLRKVRYGVYERND